MHTIRYYPKDGNRTLYPIDFRLGFLDRSHVHIYVDENPKTQVEYNWVNNGQISLKVPIPEGKTLKIRRIVPKTLFNDYNNKARLSEQNLNDSLLQSLMLHEEVLDGFLGEEFRLQSIRLILKHLSMEGDIDMSGHRIINLPEPIGYNEPVRLIDLENVLGFLPTDAFTAEDLEEIKLGSDLPSGVFEFDTIEYEVGKTVRSIDVFLNGSLLYRDFDYTEESAVSIRLNESVLSNLLPDDIVSVRTKKLVPSGQSDQNGILLISGIENLRELDPSKVNIVYLISYYNTTSSLIYGLGAGEFIFNPYSTENDNGGTVIKPNSVEVGRWVRKDRSIGKVSQYGAVGDGQTNDSEAIQRCLDNHHDVLFDIYRDQLDVVYEIDEPLIITVGGGKTIRGLNRAKCVIRKVTETAPNLTRTYGGVEYNFNEPCIFAFVAADESYVRHVVVRDIRLQGAGGNRTLIHVEAPRSSYISFTDVDSSNGKHFWRATSVSFVNSFNNVRSNLKSEGHWFTAGIANAYNFYNTYANSNVTGADASCGYILENTNATFTGGDTDSVNFGWLIRGNSRVVLNGCFTESRLGQVRTQDTAIAYIYGGRYAMTAIGSQASSVGAIFDARDNSRIIAYSPSLSLFDFTNGALNRGNRFIARSRQNARIDVYDFTTFQESGNTKPMFESDLLRENDSTITIVRDGKLRFKDLSGTTLSTGGLDRNRVRYLNITHDTNDVSNPSRLTKEIFRIQGLDYSTVLNGSLDIKLRSSGTSGNQSLAGQGVIKFLASKREALKVVSTEVPATTDPVAPAQTAMSYIYATTDSTIHFETKWVKRQVAPSVEVDDFVVNLVASSGVVGTIYLEVYADFLATRHDRTWNINIIGG